MSIPPWGDHRAKVDGVEFERLVVDHLREASRNQPDFRLEQQEKVRTPDGQYRIDVTVRFSQLDGAQFLVLVECKDHARPVEREDVQVLESKKRAAEASKAMLFSTNGFQQGAIEYAKSHRIGLVRLLEGVWVYETRSWPRGGPRPAPPPWMNIPEFVGQLVRDSLRRLDLISLPR